MKFRALVWVFLVLMWHAPVAAATAGEDPAEGLQGDPRRSSKDIRDISSEDAVIQKHSDGGYWIVRTTSREGFYFQPDGLAFRFDAGGRVRDKGAWDTSSAKLSGFAKTAPNTVGWAEKSLKNAAGRTAHDRAEDLSADRNAPAPDPKEKRSTAIEWAN